MKRQDREYYTARLRQEEEAARSAADPRAAQSHEMLAREYADLIGATDDARRA